MNAKEQFHYYNQSDIFNLNPHFSKSPLSLRNRTPLSNTQPVDTNRKPFFVNHLNQSILI